MERISTIGYTCRSKGLPRDRHVDLRTQSRRAIQIVPAYERQLVDKCGDTAMLTSLQETRKNASVRIEAAVVCRAIAGSFNMAPGDEGRGEQGCSIHYMHRVCGVVARVTQHGNSGNNCINKDCV